MAYIGKNPTAVPLTSSDIEDGIITTAKIADDAATADKIANAVNSAISDNTAKTGISSAQASAIIANTAKTTNATHSGEVTGSGALTIADNIVDEANLKVSNAPTNGYFLAAQSGNTGGLTWQEAGGGGKILQVSSFVQTSSTQTLSSDSFADLSGVTVAITPSASNSKILIITNIASNLQNDEGYGMQFVRGSTSVYATLERYSVYGYGITTLYNFTNFQFIDSPNTTSEITYKVQVRSHQSSAVVYNTSVNSNIYLMEIGA